MISLTAFFLLLVATADLHTSAETDAQRAQEVQETIDEVVDSSRRLVPAKQIERSAPIYPRKALREGRQAWVRVAYCIDESGATQNVTVLDSVGTERFNKAAVNAVKRWRYEPALIDGQPSWQSRNQTIISFAIDGRNRGGSRRFVKQFKKIRGFLDEQNFEEADNLFWHVYETFDLSLYELAKLWALRARYEGARGDIYKLDTALHRATASKGQWIDKESYVQLLKLRTRVEVQTGQYRSAINSFNQLVKATAEDSEEVVELRPLVQRLKDMIDSDAILKISAKVMTKDECHLCNDSWAFSPVRNDFKLASINGNLTSIEMRCDHERFESAVSDLVEWHIPDSWGTCHVQIYGDPGTTFDVLLMPANSETPSTGFLPTSVPAALTIFPARRQSMESDTRCRLSLRPGHSARRVDQPGIR